MKTKEYKLISNKDKDKLVQEVNEHINNGRELYGNPLIDGVGVMSQAMVLKKDIDKDIK